MLQRGGNAVDAALATAIALTVVEPCSNGIGSDLFAIVWDGRALAGLNASGRAPAAVTAGALRGRGRRAAARLGVASRFRARSPAGPRCRSVTAPCPSPNSSCRRSATRATATRCRRSSPRNGRSRRRCCRTTWASPSTSCRAAARRCPARPSPVLRWRTRSRRSPRRTATRSIAASSRRRWSPTRNATGPRTRSPTSPTTRSTGSRRSRSTTAARRCTRSRPTARASPRRWRSACCVRSISRRCRRTASPCSISRSRR